MRVKHMTPFCSDGTGDLGFILKGPLILYDDPQQPREAATKRYVDSRLGNLDAGILNGGVIGVSTLPKFGGDVVMTKGDNYVQLTETGVMPGSYPKVTVDEKGRVVLGLPLSISDIPKLDWSKVVKNKPTTLQGYGITDALGVSGGIVGPLFGVDLEPTDPLHLVNREYFNRRLSDLNIIPIGSLVEMVTLSTPEGYLKANGALLSKQTYSDLYSVIGDKFNNLGMYQGYGRPWEQQFVTGDSDLQLPNLSSLTPLSTYQVNRYGGSSVFALKGILYLLGNSTTPSIGTVQYLDSVNFGDMDSYKDVAMTRGKVATTGLISGSSSGDIDASDIPFIKVEANRGSTRVVMNTTYSGSGQPTFGPWPIGHVSYYASSYHTPENVTAARAGWGTPQVTISQTYEGGNHTGVKSFQGILSSYSFFIEVYADGEWHPAGRAQVHASGSMNLNSMTFSASISGVANDGTDLGTFTSISGNLRKVEDAGYFYYPSQINLMGHFVRDTSNDIGFTDIAIKAIDKDFTRYNISTGGQTPGSLKLTWPDVSPAEIAGDYLPSGVLDGEIVTTSNKVYLLGGSINGIPTNKIYSATISPGTKTDNVLHWQASGTLPESVKGGKPFYSGESVFYVGGTTSSGHSNKIWRAPVAPNGTLGTWSLHKTLPVGITGHSLLILDDYIYILGGHTSTGNNRKIYKAVLNTNATFGNIVEYGSLPVDVGVSNVFVNNYGFILLGLENEVVGIFDDERDLTIKETRPAQLNGDYSRRIMSFRGELFVLDSELEGEYTFKTFNYPTKEVSSEHYNGSLGTNIASEEGFRVPDMTLISNPNVYYIKYT